MIQRGYHRQSSSSTGYPTSTRACAIFAGIIATTFLIPRGLHPQTPAELTRKGVEYSDKKMYNEAIKEFKKAIDTYNINSARSYHNMGWAFELKGDTTEAIKYYEEAARRNPLQIHTQERMGYLYFKAGEYEKAVTTGEYVLKLQPQNKEVIQWLPEAYRMRELKRQELLARQKEEEERKKREESLLKAALEKKAEEERKPNRLIYATAEAMLRLGYYFNGKVIAFVPSYGFYSNFPEMINVNATPTPDWEFDLKFGNPYLGALAPNLVSHTERLQALYRLNGLSIGMGVMGNHYRDNFNFGGTRTLSDVKCGIIVGHQDEKSRFLLTMYPRYLPYYDNSNSTGKTMDVDYFELRSETTLNKSFSYYVLLSANDYFFYDHRERISNYWGVYNLCFGIVLSKFHSLTKKKIFSFTIEYAERFYFRDLRNNDPYRIFNGQGWAGIDTRTWFRGNPVPGYYTQGHAFSLRVEEYIGSHFFIYQKFMLEIAGERGDHNEFCLLLGAGGTY